ncbi:MAG: translocation/assembly module TamB domain-containing protein [Calditrichaceae bacterium]
MEKEVIKKSRFKTLLSVMKWIFVGIFLSMLIIILLHWQTNVVANAIASYLNHELKDTGRIHYTSLKGNLLNHVIIENLEFELNDQLYLSSNHVDLKYNLLPLLKNKVKLSRIFFDSLSINVPGAKELQIDEDKKEFVLDSTLAQLQKAVYVDSLLRTLPEIDLNDFEIVAGKVDIVNPKLGFDDIYVKFDLSVKRDSYKLNVSKLSGNWPDKDFELSSLHFQIIGDERHVTINQFQLSTERSKIFLTTDIYLEDSLHIVLSFDEIKLDLYDLYLLTGDEKFKDGNLSGKFVFIGSPRNFGMDLALKGRWNDLFVRNAALKGEYEYGDINVDYLKISANDADVYFKGMLNQVKGIEGLLTFKNINLHQFARQYEPSRINGNLNFKLDGLNFKRPTGQGSLYIFDSSLGNISLDSLRFAIRATKGDKEIMQPSYVQFNSFSRFNLYGTLDSKNQMDLKLSTKENQLGILLSQFGIIDSLDAAFDAEFMAKGPLVDPDIMGKFWIKQLNYDTVHLDSISLDLYTNRIASSRNGQATFRIKSGSIEDIPVTNVLMSVDIDSNRLEIPELSINSLQNYISAVFHVTFNDDHTEIIFNNFKAEYEKYWLSNNENIEFRIDSSGVSIERFSLHGPKKSALEISGFWDNTIEDAQIYVVLDSMSIEPFQQIWENKFSAGGVINGWIELITPFHDPIMDIKLTVDDLIYNETRLGNIRSQFQYVNKNISIQEFMITEANSSLIIGGDLALVFGKNVKKGFRFLEDTEAHLSVDWSNLSLSRYSSLFRLRYPLSGTTSGSLEMSGSVSQPVLNQNLSLVDFRYKDFTVDSLRMFAQYNSGYILVDSLQGSLNNTSFDIKGWQKFDLNLAHPEFDIADQPFELLLKSKDNEISLPGLFNEQLETILGNYELELYLGGTLNKPGVTSGFVRLNNGEILLSRVRDKIKNVTFNAEINDSVLKINNFSGYSVKKKDFLEKGWHYVRKLTALLRGKTIREGYLEAKGTVDLSEVLRPILDLDVLAQEFYVDYFVENTSLLVSSDNLKIQGRDTIMVTGDVYIPQGFYEVDLGQMQRNVYLISPSALDLQPPFIAYNLDVQIPGNFVISSSPLDLTNNFKITILGDLQTILEPAAELTKINGHLEVVSGKFSSLNQSFGVKSGSIDFTNPNKINPDINIVAEKKISSKIFQLNITGTLEQMRQDILVKDLDGNELHMTPQDKITLLTLGADTEMLSSNTDSTFRNVGEDVATTSMLTAVERGTETFTGLDKVEIESDSKFLDLQKMKLNNGLKDASISLGKYLTSDLYIEYRTQFGNSVPAPKLSWDAGNRLGLEYRINRNWSFDSYYEKTIQGNNKVQIGLSWEVTF